MQVPFWAPTEAGIFKQVLQGQLDLHAGPCKGLSQDAKHLMLSLLTRDTKVWHVHPLHMRCVLAVPPTAWSQHGCNHAEHS